jgi:hypothetical protein
MEVFNGKKPPTSQRITRSQTTTRAPMFVVMARTMDSPSPTNIASILRQIGVARIRTPRSKALNDRSPVTRLRITLIIPVLDAVSTLTDCAAASSACGG